MILLTILVFIVVLGALVFVHELGHFIMAKRAGMAVEEFGFGFPPRIFGIKRGETIYSLNWIPLGGFVKIVGENGEEAENPRSFGSKGFWARFSVLIAGVTMNAIFAWVLISICMMIGLPTIIDQGAQLPSYAHVGPAAVSVVDVSTGTPAQQAGLKVGDSIYKVNDQVINSIDQVQQITQADAGKSVAYEIKRGSSDFTVNITPRANPPAGEGPLGIALSSVARVSYPWYEAIIHGFTTTFGLAWTTISAFAQVIGQFLSHHQVTQQLSGPVGIAVLTHDVTELGLIYVLQFVAILSINLAIINAVPFPALDGGRVLFLVIEKLRGRKMNVKAESYANAIGFMLLILLMVFVTIKDVSHYSAGFKNLFSRIF